MGCLRSFGRLVTSQHRLLLPLPNTCQISSSRSLTHYPIDEKVFGLSDDHRQLRESVFNFCQKELAPHADRIDKENNFAELRQFWRKLVTTSNAILKLHNLIHLFNYNPCIFLNSLKHQIGPIFFQGDMGLLGITADTKFGGSDMGYLSHVIAMEEISRASGAIALSYGAHSNLCVNQVRVRR